MMEDKKRKKFGLSLKNAKKLAVTKSEVDEQHSTKALSSTISKEHKNASVVDAGRSSLDLEECDFKRKLEPSVNTLDKDKLVSLDNEQEQERILWQNLFSVSSTTNWETMEDLPISDISSASGMEYEASSLIRMEKEGTMKIEDGNNMSMSSSVTEELNATQKVNAFDIDLDYKELPKPCIACYARKHCPLIWTQEEKDDNDYERMEENDIDDIIPSPEDSALDISTSNIQRKTVSLKSEINVKPATLFNQNIECKKKFHLQNNSNKKQTVKNNMVSSQSSERKSSATTTDTFINLTSELPEPKSVDRQKCGISFEFKKPSGFINADLKVKSKKLNSNVGDLGTKRNVAAMKKEILKCCPMCQIQFSQKINKQEIDQHISNCIRNDEIFIDDDDDEEEEW